MRSSKKQYDAYIGQYLDRKLGEVKNHVKLRLKKVKPYYLAAYVDPRTYGLYRQVVNCYVYGNYEAGCVLCRAIAESIAKRYIEYRGYGQLLSGKDRASKVLTLRGILKERLSLPTEILSIYSQITRKADNILHRRDVQVDEKDALKAIELLQTFIKKFPRTI